MNDDEILAAGRAMVDDLPRLLGGEGSALAAALRDLLARADTGQPGLAEDVLDLLSANPVTRAELAGRLPGVVDTVRAGYPGGLPGVPSGTDAVEYTCRICGYVYPVFEAGEPVPDCPRGHGPLT